jgi:hypothetical protein
MSGCSSGEGDYDGGLRGGQLKRSTFDHWQVRQFPMAGLKAEIPVDVFYASDDIYGADIGMHPVKPPPLVLDDTWPLLVISMDRIGLEVFLKRQSDIRGSDSYVKGDDQTRVFWEWVVARHEAIERFDKGGYTYYRYEVECPDGSLIRSKAELTNLRRGGVEVDAKEDEEAIRRILESMSCIDRAERRKIPERLAG